MCWNNLKYGGRVNKQIKTHKLARIWKPKSWPDNPKQRQTNLWTKPDYSWASVATRWNCVKPGQTRKLGYPTKIENIDQSKLLKRLYQRKEQR